MFLEIFYKIINKKEDKIIIFYSTQRIELKNW